MALRKDWSAIRAEWLWPWIARGTVQVNPLFGTRVLLVAKNAQPFKTRYDKEFIKHPTRYWLGEGIILVPRWDPLDIHYDPVADDGVETLGPDELKKRGMYRLNEKILVLIYQHVEDALHFQRQQWHVSLETYAQELKEISNQLREIEDHTLKNISLKEAQFEQLGAREDNLRQRRKKIHQIIVKGIAPREKAAEILIEALWDEVQIAERRIRAILISKPVKDLLADISVTIKGLRAYLIGIYQNLNQIKVRPIVRILKVTQYSLRGALGSLDVGEIKTFKHQLKLVIENLKKAEKLLQQPRRKEEFVPKEQKIKQLRLKLKKGVV